MQNTAVMEQKTSKPGRKKIKLNDPEVLEKIVQLGSQGLTSGQIARCLGVSWSTLNRRRKEFDKIDDSSHQAWLFFGPFCLEAIKNGIDAVSCSKLERQWF